MPWEPLTDMSTDLRTHTLIRVNPILVINRFKVSTRGPRKRSRFSVRFTNVSRKEEMHSARFLLHEKPNCSETMRGVTEFESPRV